MSSGEVLFILAFIVLPTAILVSSVWAIIFVRRRPERPDLSATRGYERAEAEQDDAIERTAVLATAPAAASSDDLPVTEHDVVVITDEQEIAEEPVAAEVPEDTLPADLEPVSEPVDLPDEEPVILQSTEDLGDVVETLRDMDLVVEQEAALTDPEPEPEAIPVEDVPVPEPDVPAAEAVEFSETSELPAVDPFAPVEQPEDEDDQPDEPAPEERAGSSWRRRRQQVKLLPGDSDAPRARGRNRESQRQVPQLNRAARKRDDARNLPPDNDPDQESTPGRT